MRSRPLNHLLFEPLLTSHARAVMRGHGKCHASVLFSLLRSMFCSFSKHSCLIVLCCCPHYCSESYYVVAHFGSWQLPPRDGGWVAMLSACGSQRQGPAVARSIQKNTCTSTSTILQRALRVCHLPRSICKSPSPLRS